MTFVFDGENEEEAATPAVEGEEAKTEAAPEAAPEATPEA